MGFCAGLNLLRWSHVTHHDWDGVILRVEGVNHGHKDVEIAAVVGESERGIVDRLLHLELVQRRGRFAGAEQGAVETINRPRIVLSLARNVTFRGVISAFTAYAVLSVLVALRPMGGAPREFFVGVLLAAMMGLAELAWRARRIASSGAPLVRLHMKYHWPSVAAASLVVAGSYALNQTYALAVPILALACGVGAGCGAAWWASALMRDRIDLCENGLVLIPWTYLPWEKVRVVRWRSVQSGRELLLRSGWRWIAAKVPEDSVDAVEYLLRAKVGHDAGGCDAGNP